MSKLQNRVLKGGAGFFASKVIVKIFGFLFIVVCSRILGAEEFGVYALGLSILGVVANIGGMGLPNTIQRFLSGEGEKRVEYIYGTVLLITAVSAILLSLSFFFFSRYMAIELFNEPKLISILQILSIGVGLTIIYNISKAILQAQEKIKETVITKATESFLRVILLLGFILWMKTAVSAVLAHISAIFITLLYISKILKGIQFRPLIPQKKDFKKVVSYSMPLVIVGFSYFIMQQTDRLMLGWLSTSSNVGIYTAISSLALIMTVFHSSLVAIFKPVASEAFRQNNIDQLNNTYLFISKWVGGFNGIVLLIFAGIGIWILGVFGEDYTGKESYIVLLLLSFLYFVSTWLGPTAALLQMSDGHILEFYNTLVFLGLNIVLNYYLIIQYGVVGAAWATLLSGLVRNFLQAIEIWFEYRLNVINEENTGFIAIVILGILLCYNFPEYSIILFAIFIFVVLLYKYLFITREEKKLLQLLLSKVSRREGC